MTQLSGMHPGDSPAGSASREAQDLAHPGSLQAESGNTPKHITGTSDPAALMAVLMRVFPEIGDLRDPSKLPD